MRYHDVEPISGEAAEAAFASGESSQIIEAILSLSYHDPDWRWVQNRCIPFADYDDPLVRRAFAWCALHLARIHGVLDEDSVMPILEKLAEDKEIQVVAGIDDVNDTLKQIDIFLGTPRRRWHRG